VKKNVVIKDIRKNAAFLRRIGQSSSSAPERMTDYQYDTVTT